MESLYVAFVEASYLNTDMCKFESSWSEESRATGRGQTFCLQARNSVWLDTPSVQAENDKIC